MARSSAPRAVRYAIVHLLKADTGAVQRWRNHYDPNARLIQPHITLVFPFEADAIAMQYLIAHIARVAKDAAPFDAHLSHLELSWDQWLFLTPDRGRESLVQLHDRLYEGPLQPFHRFDLPFVPHVSIGYFGSLRGGPDLGSPEASGLDQQRYDEFSNRVDRSRLQSNHRVAEIELISVNPAMTSTDIIQSFPLGS